MRFLPDDCPDSRGDGGLGKENRRKYANSPSFVREDADVQWADGEATTAFDWASDSAARLRQ